MKKLFLFLFFVFTFTLFLNASEPAIWTINTRAEVLRGEARGVSIDENGAITLAPNLTEIFNTSQSYIWSSATDAAGNIYLGTGSDGKIFKVSPGGAGTLFYDSAELNVAALAIGRNGEVYAGTSPDGKVYRIDASGNAAVFFEPNEKYIWSLAVLPDGSLAVGTGENGRIYKVKSAGASAANSLLFDTSETHIISLAADRQGNLYAGTDSNGLVLRFGADGKPFALLDSPLREIHDLEVGADGSVYALALSNSVAAARPPISPETPPTPDVTAPAAPQTPKSRYDLSAAKSAVYRILPDGGSDVIWNSPSVVGFSLLPNQTGNGVLVGTSDKGRIYSVTNDGRETLVLQTNENQISTLFSSGQNLYATSSNQGKIYRFGGAAGAEGSYESPVLDARAAASWGRIWWRGAGNAEKPDETWSAWSAALTDAKGAQISSPVAKHLQWRAILRNPNAVLNEVNVAYLPRNIAPEILSIEILPTNVGLLPNPAIVIDPNIESSGLDPQIFGIVVPPALPRKVYLRGARALQWTAEDRNGDKLVYNVYYREVGETNFKLLKENLTETFYTIDGLAFADGRYIFKIAATDAPSNPVSTSLTGEKLSETVEIDNSAPTVAAVGQPQITGGRGRVVFEAADAASYLTKAEYSVNGGEWKTVYADDGISDSPRERYTIEISLPTPGEYSVTLRVFDANGNVGNARAVIKR
jgi:sugar lactone lactonase YvrE